MIRKILLFVIYFYALLISVLKTIRLPNDWSQAHWLLDYRFGFIKRGLAGELFGFVCEKTEPNLLFVSACILAILYTLLLTFSLRISYLDQKNYTYNFLFYVLFFLSQYIVFSAHLIGYLDHLIFIFTFCAIALIRNKQIFLSSLLMSFSLLIHEISLFLMLPICLFTILFLEFNTKEFSLKELFSSTILKKIILFLFAPIAVLLFVVVYQESFGKVNFTTISNYLQQTKFIDKDVAHSVASAYTDKFTYYFQEQSPHFFQRIFVSKASVLFGLPILFMMYLLFLKYKKTNIYLLSFLVIVILFPLLLHAIAWDTYRIWAFPYMILFFGNWILSFNKNHATSNYKIPNWILCVFTILVCLMLFFSNYLFDGEIERFSFIQRILFLIPLLIALFLLRKRDVKF